MNIVELAEYLKSQGHVVGLGEYRSIACIDVTLAIGDLAVELLHFPQNEYSNLPRFYLKKPESYGQLAHVNTDSKTGLGNICVNDQDSVSVNYERPFLAIEESLNRHYEILNKGLTDSDWNINELLREFYSNWQHICGLNKYNLICASADGRLEQMEVLRPESGKKIGFSSLFLGVSNSASELADYAYITREIKNKKRTVAGCAIIIPLNNLLPAPSSIDDIGNWYLNAITAISEKDKKEFFEKFALIRANEHWVVFNADSPSGRTWFGLHFQLNNKRCLPTTRSSLNHCKITPVSVQMFNKKRIMPRSGASLPLSDKKVLLVGCGSVGGEIAHKLASAGIGTLILDDTDYFSLDNIYRHVLTQQAIGWHKSNALAFDLNLKYPWIKAEGYSENLLKLRNKEILELMDIIIIAIGSPTQERIFHDYLIKNKVNVPVINTWVEGYGVGGHATLDIPASKGCLRCAYVDQDSLMRGLASNLNFFDYNQDLTVNHAGCGELYLPYSAISAAQTALIASNLAVKYLNGDIQESSKISWKGDASEAIENGFALSNRYELFNDSLKILPLYNKYCDICNE